jgi:hypothetical protein
MTNIRVVVHYYYYMFRHIRAFHPQEVCDYVRVSANLHSEISC